MRARSWALLGLISLVLGVAVVWVLLHVVPTHLLDRGWGIVLGLFGLVVICFSLASAGHSIRRNKGTKHDQLARVIGVGTLVVTAGLVAGLLLIYLAAR